jgi:hypothetical protein
MTLSRYAPGGDIYADIENRYGAAAANRVYAAAASDPTGAALRETLSDIKTGFVETEENQRGMWDQLGYQLYHEPLNAPIETAAEVLTNAAKAAGNAAKKAAKAVAGNWGLWLIILGGLAVLFFYLGGASIVRRQFK